MPTLQKGSFDSSGNEWISRTRQQMIVFDQNWKVSQIKYRIFVLAVNF
jgi:hypothetical protein